jgi:hypothetical protein
MNGNWGSIRKATKEKEVGRGKICGEKRGAGIADTT